MSKRRRLAEVPLTPAEQMLSSCVGAMATSLIVTPFDVVKTRMQVAGMGGCHQCGDVFILRCVATACCLPQRMSVSKSSRVAPGGGGADKLDCSPQHLAATSAVPNAASLHS